MTIDYGLAIGVISAIAAIISGIYAFVAVKVAERSSTIDLIVELHQRYHSDTVFRSTQIVWKLYQKACVTEQEYENLLKKCPSIESVLGTLVVRDLGDGKVYIDTYKILDDERAELGKGVFDEIVERANRSADGTPISPRLASHFVQTTDRESPEWEAVHNASSFWRYIALLVEKQFIDKSVAFEAFWFPKDTWIPLSG